MTKAKVKITGPKVQDYIKSLGLLPRGKIQTFVDSEIVRLTDPKVPSDTTHTRKSVFYDDYKNDKELTIFTLLDGADFYEPILRY